MHYHQYYPIDVVNGPGTRCTLFVSGCEHQCGMLQPVHLATGLLATGALRP